MPDTDNPNLHPLHALQELITDHRTRLRILQDQIKQENSVLTEYERLLTAFDVGTPPPTAPRQDKAKHKPSANSKSTAKLVKGTITTERAQRMEKLFAVIQNHREGITLPGIRQTGPFKDANYGQVYGDLVQLEAQHRIKHERSDNRSVTYHVIYNHSESAA